MKMIKFYDTSSLLLLNDIPADLAISAITLEELEHIKTASNKDTNIKLKAHNLVKRLNNRIGTYKVVYYSNELISYLPFDSTSNDAKIIACARSFKEYEEPEIVFVTNDLCMKLLAQKYFPVESIELKEDYYTGYKDLTLNEEQLDAFYSEAKNDFNCLENEYLVIKNLENEVIDLRVWRNDNWEYLDSKPIKTRQFGVLTPYDIYQKMAIDCMRNNQLTVLRGPAGSGKSCFALSYLFHLLETYQIDKIFIFCNPVATKDSAKLGFYPGDRNTKLLDSQIGNFLIGKLGDITAAEQLVSSGKLVLMPAADIRGVDIPAGSGVYITEAQNSTKDLMKLMVQRISEDTKVIIEGDELAQVDLSTYEGKNNGLTRLSEVFRGEPYYGEVRLNKCYRSRMAEKAELM